MNTSRLSIEEIAEAREFAEQHGVDADALFRSIEKCCIDLGVAFQLVMQGFRDALEHYAELREIRLAAKELAEIVFEPIHIEAKRTSEPWRQGKRRGAPCR